MDARSVADVRAAGDAPTPRALPAEPRQRWRIAFRRGPGAETLAQREVAAAWEAGIRESALPVLAGGRRPWLAFAAPLPVGMPAERDLADLWLAEVRPAWQVREALEGALPRGYELVDLYDVWIGAPALAAQVAAADYRVEIDADAATAGELRAAADAMLAAHALPRERAKGSGTVQYDLRPLIIDVTVADDSRPRYLRIRTRFDPALGTGRPEEVVAELGERLGQSVAVLGTTRERVLLAEDIAVRRDGVD